MGTNYYAEFPAKNVCAHCKRGDGEEELHIGKSSCGWAFALHIYPERKILNLYDWISLLLQKGVKIRDEYGEYKTIEWMIRNIMQRDRPVGELLRSKPDAYHTQGAGEGTWDYCLGDFS
jgi:hypothetical protein